MRTDLFDFELPEAAIALHPASPRDSARMLVVPDGAGPFEDRGVRDLPGLLCAGDALVFNDTRVIPAALEGVRRRGDLTANVALTLIERLGANRWRALARPAKRLQAGDRLHFGHSGEMCMQGALDATVEGRGDAGEVDVAFDLSGPDLDAAIAAVGEMPLPPYIAGKRGVEAADRADYQTVYAAHDGAVAAPTAGLHFTPKLFEALAARGIEKHFVTLHVGAGTFLPVKAEDTAGHKMHSEWGEVSAETVAALKAVRARGGRIVAVGTTSLRLLESASAGGQLEPFSGSTDIFITPGYRFRSVDILMTNFHLPRSTLFMLVSAFAGLERMQAAYAHAIAQGYRFYSYGDSSLLFRAD
ncbi:tRNA preQ1(34) S-adenosylmethionine ribosyltransferase-isomerase [Hyphomicrobium sp. 1Nfss2.1]|uniref:tRNA preQ1(34) S-adenosylmethionine ribosyltransferase-isomerase QueA n=1 Tax=Hyphomicrobium sp. 1Nfss2.1 TaxID=3413936 RepID=UPI003C7A53CC